MSVCVCARPLKNKTSQITYKLLFFSPPLWTPPLKWPWQHGVSINSKGQISRVSVLPVCKSDEIEWDYLHTLQHSSKSCALGLEGERLGVAHRAAGRIWPWQISKCALSWNEQHTCSKTPSYPFASMLILKWKYLKNEIARLLGYWMCSITAPLLEVKTSVLSVWQRCIKR